MLKRREKEIELLGLKFKLFERTAGEVQAFAEFVQKNYPGGKIDPTTNYILSCDIIQASIKPNFIPFLWIKRPLYYWKLKRLMKTKRMIKKLTSFQIVGLCNMIIEELELTPENGEKKKDKRVTTNH